MNDETFERVCDKLIDYLSGECTKEERKSFESHLTYCTSCRQELAELQNVWEALSLDMEQIEPPQDLKEQIMAAAKAAPKPKKSLVYGNWLKPLIAVGAAVLIFFSGSLWHNSFTKDQPMTWPSIENALIAPSSQIVKLNMLKAEASEKEHAYGVACIVENGGNKQFVVYVFGAQATKENEAYQVWLLRDGVRSSAGTFQVDEKGIGLLSMVIDSDELVYDRIGITLEPDEKGNQPRGPKVFGT
ncbi:Anti-sigma-W factor RsiW [compost metagenome]